MGHLSNQLAYFASFDRKRRWDWQKDPFIAQREQEPLRPLIEELERRTRAGRVRVLESGCGDGLNVMHVRQYIASDRFTWTGVDITPEAVAFAQSQHIDASLGDGCKLTFPDASFDIVYCRDVFHHLENTEQQKAFFAEMWRVTAPGGVVFAIEPNPLNPAMCGLAALVSAERGLFSITERRMKRLFPGAKVQCASASSAWRMWLHYFSPLLRFKHRKPIEIGLLFWEKVCQKLAPKMFWSYRVYIWHKSS